MEVVSLESVKNTTSLVNIAHVSNEPIVVLDGDTECLVAMSLEVLDRLLFDANLLNHFDRGLNWY